MSKIDLYFIEYIKETEYYMFDKTPFTDDKILEMRKNTFTYSLFKSAYEAFSLGIKEFKTSINDGDIKVTATLQTNIMIGYIEIYSKDRLKDTVVENRRELCVK